MGRHIFWYILVRLLFLFSCDGNLIWQHVIHWFHYYMMLFTFTFICTCMLDYSITRLLESQNSHSPNMDLDIWEELVVKLSYMNRWKLALESLQDLYQRGCLLYTEPLARTIMRESCLLLFTRRWKLLLLNTMPASSSRKERWSSSHLFIEIFTCFPFIYRNIYISIPANLSIFVCPVQNINFHICQT